MIHWRNHLHHYRYSIHKIVQNVDIVHLDVDFAENLSISVKYEPQSLHWSYEQVTKHSGIVKLPTIHKSYHPSGLYSSTNWPRFTWGQNSILNWVLKLNALNQKSESLPLFYSRSPLIYFSQDYILKASLMEIINSPHCNKIYWEGAEM